MNALGNAEWEVRKRKSVERNLKRINALGNAEGIARNPWEEQIVRRKQ